MVKNPPENMPRITPCLYYEDVASVLGWLTRAFGFCERMRMPGPDGRVMHAEVELADRVVMRGHPGADYRNPKRLGHHTQITSPVGAAPHFLPGRGSPGAW